ncbi:MAG: hypothetical protein [Bacteriophage sp.]|jgi:hypothetical protein|uniref:Uncharacterized protein n=1 Tax=Myoviridae sp. ctNQV2 TaxID=2827683 RepID=A0A8S5RZ91_9CAUD|nr:MAG: hypothetical protein [Bacteriophage sp.]UWF79459.1 MAG: hypothetical protein [Bacteriophage sp.]UWF82554.1 MAG: hypothetical protein [Bacteriophage sp.]DAF43827.1 MAG TPA: hypothetical protein [Myoviridae sp. ctNQV2]
MRKLIGTIVVILLIIVGFTGVNLKVNGTAFKIPPYIKNVVTDKKKMEEAKKVFNTAKEKLSDEIKDEK